MTPRVTRPRTLARPEDLGQLGGRRDLELVTTAALRPLVGAPAEEDGGVPETVALEVVVLHLAHPLDPQRLPREVLALAPAALDAGHADAATHGHGPLAPGMLGERVLAERR